MAKFLGASVLGLVMVPGTAFAQPAQPQPAAAPNGGGLQEIIVTAQKRSERLQDVPIAISSVTTDQIVDRGVTDSRDLGRLVPSLNVVASTGHALPSLRGVGTALVGPGFESPVALYVDGVYYADSAASLLSFNNVSQIDVLKGPQGTLFGRNSTGGVIQVTTKDPSSHPEMNGSVSYGNYETITAKAYVSEPLTAHFAGDVAVQYTHQGKGYGTNITTGEETNQLDRDFAVRSKLLYDSDAGTRVTLSGDYSQTRTSIGAALGNAPGRKPLLGPLVETGNVRDIESDVEPLLRLNAGGVSGKIEQELGTLHLVSITAYRKSYYDLFFDADETPVKGALVNVIERNHQFSQEVQLLSNPSNDRFKWVVGAFYYAARGAFDPSQLNLYGPLVNPAIPLDEIQTVASQKTRSIAGFAEAKIGLTSTTHITVGGRVTHEKRTLDAIQLGYLAGGIPIGNLITPINGMSMSVTKPTWRLVVDQKLSDDVLLYASYNRGFKSGGFNTSIPTDPPYKPEKLDAYEAGFKSTLFDRRLRFNAAGYYYDYGNYQAASFILGNIRVNNASARIYGAEADMDAALTHQFRVNAGIGWVHARFTSFPDGTLSTPLPIGGTLQTPANLSGNDLPYVPSFTATVGGTYTVQAFGGKLVIDSSLYHNSGWPSEADNLLHQKSYELVTGSIAWTDPSNMLTIRAWGKNLTNANVATQISSSSLATAITYQQPRTYGLELGFKF